MEIMLSDTGIINQCNQIFIERAIKSWDIDGSEGNFEDYICSHVLQSWHKAINELSSEPMGAEKCQQ